MSARYELYRSDRDAQYYFRLKAGNGEIILHSEGYHNKGGAENGIQSVKVHSPSGHNYDRRKSARNQPYFVLKASNGQIIGMSQMYASTSARDTGISSVQSNGPSATVQDLT